jgi:hypothetical protein
MVGLSICSLHLFSSYRHVSQLETNLAEKAQRNADPHGDSMVLFGTVLLILIASFVSWLTPRPGSTQQWAYAANTVNVKIQEASQWAMQWNPAGEGEGIEKNLADQSGDSLAKGMEGDEGNQGQQNPEDSSAIRGSQTTVIRKESQ